MFPTEAFATTTRRKILRILAERNRRYTIEELAEMCQRSEASISRALQRADRYPFIDKDRVSGSKQLTFRLDPESLYAAAIRDFFDVERDRERQNGTIPVEVWNLLEDVTDRFQDKVDGFVELFLFGSYATGEYYAGSDIDLLLAHTTTEDVGETIDQVVQKIGDDRLHVIPVQLMEKQVSTLDGTELVDAVQEGSPASGGDVLIPLSGEVSA